MSESYPYSDDFGEERIVPLDSVPLSYHGLDFTLTPANAAVRLFTENGLEEYSRVVVYPGDGTNVSFKPDVELLQMMVRGGFPVELPGTPDETDQEFMDEFMRMWTEDMNEELESYK